MDETAETVETTAVAEQTPVDTTGVALGAAAAVIALALLLWHVQQVKKRPATTYDKAVGGLWAAVVVLAIMRVIALLT